MNRALWIVQGLLAALFVLGASFRFTMPMDELAAMTGLPAALIVFISICEILGGIGLIVPWLTGIKRGLTPLAAILLVVIMLGATAISAMASIGTAIFPFIVGILLLVIARGRSRTA